MYFILESIILIPAHSIESLLWTFRNNEYLLFNTSGKEDYDEKVN